MENVTLFQFPISHYCEKARWALDYKRVKYEIKNVLPGPHLKQIRKIAPKTHVPVVQSGNKTIQGSNHIIDHLDQTIDDQPLTPKSEDQKADALDWERYAEKNIGDPIRCIFYHELLEAPKILIPALIHQGPWYGKWLYKIIYSRFKLAARAGMRINAETSAQSRTLLNDAINNLNQHLANRSFIVGKQFSRADLAVAALFSPLITPPDSYFIWWDNMPSSLRDLRDRYRNDRVYQWVNEIYQNYR